LCNFAFSIGVVAMGTWHHQPTSALLHQVSYYLLSGYWGIFLYFSRICCYIVILQSTTALSAGDKYQLSIQSIQYHGTSCLELSVSSYNLTFEDAIELALDKSLWRLLVASGATH